MSGPNEPAANLLGGLFGGMGAKKGPLPTMPIGQTKKRMGDERIPMSREVPRRNPGQAQDAAARKLGVPNYQVQPQDRGSATPRPQAPPVQAPKTPIMPDRPAAPPQAPIQAPPPPTLPREENPSRVSGVPMPRERPLGADVAGMLSTIGGGEPASAAMMAKVLEKKMQPPAGAPAGPPSTFPYFDVAGALGLGGGQPSASSATASAPPTGPVAPPPDPFSRGAPGIQAGPEQLMQVMAAAKRAAQERAPPATPPTPASPSVTPPVPPGRPIPPPPSAQPPMGPEGNPENFRPSLPSFQGYVVVPGKPGKGEEKHTNKVDKKGNSPYYYTRVGAQIGDNTAVAQRLREIREKASNPRTARNMTVEEDRILAQYGDGSAKNADTSLLSSMEPAAVAERMRMYKSGNLVGQIPDRYEERPPGVGPEGGGRTPLKLPPKTTQKRDAAEDKANDAIQNPPKRNATDKDEDATIIEE